MLLWLSPIHEDRGCMVRADKAQSDLIAACGRCMLERDPVVYEAGPPTSETPDRECRPYPASNVDVQA